MKLHDSPMLSFNRPPMPPSVGPMSNPMPLDPWLTSPMSSATPMHTIPGFMGSPQGLQQAYSSHSFLNTPPGMVQGMQPMGPPPYQCPPSFNDKYPMEDDRSSSIAALRMKAKEHLQSMDKTWQHMWSWGTLEGFLSCFPWMFTNLFFTDHFLYLWRRYMAPKESDIISLMLISNSKKKKSWLILWGPFFDLARTFLEVTLI